MADVTWPERDVCCNCGVRIAPANGWCAFCKATGGSRIADDGDEWREQDGRNRMVSVEESE